LPISIHSILGYLRNRHLNLLNKLSKRMNKIATTHLEIPRDFQIACEGFGIMVPDFMQLLVDHFSYAYVFISDDSVNELATQAFRSEERVILDPQPLLKTNITLGKVARESLPHMKKIVHLGMS